MPGCTSVPFSRLCRGRMAIARSTGQPANSGEVALLARCSFEGIGCRMTANGNDTPSPWDTERSSVPRTTGFALPASGGIRCRYPSVSARVTHPRINCLIRRGVRA